MEYPLEGVFGYPSLMSDELHPNGAGYMKMENNIFQALLGTFKQNGMLR
jgi:lysophospholipase L1-like esterase